MVRAVIFDFDGVIANSEPAHHASTNAVLADFNIEISKQDYYEKCVGYTDLQMFEAVRRQYNTDFAGRTMAQLIQQKADVFNELISKENHLIDGVTDLLGLLKKNRIRTAICSGASMKDIMLMLSHSQLTDSFETIVSADDVEKGKPDPAGYLLALEKLNQNETEKITPEQCVAIEDSRWGLQAAMAAGMHTIAVTNSYSFEELSMAERVVENLREITLDFL